MNLAKWADLRAGSFAAEEIAKRLGVTIEKALDPLNPSDFLTICVRLAASLQGAVKGTEGVALKSALDGLDVDWPNLSADGRDKIIAASRNEIAALGESIPSLAGPVLEGSAESLVARTRVATVGKFSFGYQLKDEAPIDRETIEHLPGSQLVYIKDQYGRRADSMDAIAKETVAGGLEKGLGRDDISGELSSRLKESGVLRTGNYWDLIASDFANKARTSTQLNTLGRAEVEQYQFEAILDEATSEICRLLHGRRFSVQKAAARMQSTIKLRDPEEAKNAMPWVQQGTDSAGNAVLYYTKNGKRTTVANIDSPGEGTKDAIGTYSNPMSNKALEAAGLPVPPRHGHCRSTIITVV